MACRLMSLFFTCTSPSISCSESEYRTTKYRLRNSRARPVKEQGTWAGATQRGSLIWALLGKLTTRLGRLVIHSEETCMKRARVVRTSEDAYG